MDKLCNMNWEISNIIYQSDFPYMEHSTDSEFKKAILLFSGDQINQNNPKHFQEKNKKH